MKIQGFIFSIFYLMTAAVLLCGCQVTPQQSGSLTVSITPPEAIDAGAQWRVDNGQWENSGSTLQGLSLGEHTVSFKSINGWTAPAVQTATIVPNKTILVTGNYLPLSVTPAR
jgi:hypothetical protein